MHHGNLRHVSMTEAQIQVLEHLEVRCVRNDDGNLRPICCPRTIVSDPEKYSICLENNYFCLDCGQRNIDTEYFMVFDHTIFANPTEGNVRPSGDSAMDVCDPKGPSKKRKLE